MKQLIIFLLCSFLAGCTSKQQKQEEECYLFSFFGDQEAGLMLAYSHDGLHWEVLNNGQPLMTPAIGNQRIMRDPSIAQGPDGTFHLVWTVSWADNGIGHATSRDLIHWSEQQFIPVMAHEPATSYCWAPEIFYDDATERFYIIWASTVKGKHDPVPHTPDEAYNNPRQYMTSTKDFVEFTPAQKYYDKGFAVIDAFMLKEKGTYYLFVKNENSLPAEKNIRISTAPSVIGPFSNPSGPITGNTYWAEGAACLKVGDKFYLYYDCYRGVIGYGARMSTDLKNWTDVTDQLVVPEGMKHGTPFKVSCGVLDGLLKLGQNK